MKQGGIPGTFGNGANAGGQTGLSPFNNLPGIDAANVDSSAVKMGWDSTIRGKLGTLVTPTTLIYGVGGIAFQDVSVSAACVPTNGGIIGAGFGATLYASSYCGLANRPPPPFFVGTSGPVGTAKSQTFSSVRTGWTVGLGIESVLSGNWIGKFEARYADFGNYKNTFFAGTSDFVTASVRVQTVTALAGISYKFDPSGSVAANY
jgi:outer membrane immunogenic protein